MKFNQLSEAQEERFAILTEELGETLQIIGKICRHGLNSSRPTEIQTNRDLLVKELGDVLVAIDFLVSNGEIDLEKLRERVKNKSSSVWDYVHCQNAFTTYQGALIDLIFERELPKNYSRS